jgi:hypothetical protein
LNRTVNANDFRLFYANYSPTTSGRTWSQGDFNDDGVVDFTDYQILQRYYGQTVPFGSLPLDAAVPEPTHLIPLLIAVTLTARRRKPRSSLRPTF